MEMNNPFVSEEVIQVFRDLSWWGGGSMHPPGNPTSLCRSVEPCYLSLMPVWTLHLMRETNVLKGDLHQGWQVSATV